MGPTGRAIYGSGARPVGLRVIRETATHARRHVQPAEKRLRQRQLMIRVRAARRILQGIREAGSDPADGLYV